MMGFLRKGRDREREGFLNKEGSRERERELAWNGGDKNGLNIRFFREGGEKDVHSYDVVNSQVYTRICLGSCTRICLYHTFV